MRIATALLLFVMAARSAAAQETTGDIRGRLRTSNGAPIAGATLVATSPDLLGARRVVSAGDGVFQFLSLPPGMYAIRVTAIGHNPMVINSVRVQLGRTAGLGDLSLPPSSAQLSEVRVEAPRTNLDPTRTAIGATLTAADYAALPTGERDIKSLLTILPHVNTSYHGDGINVGGSTGLENAWFIDGVNVTAPLNGMSGTTLPYNFVREVEVRVGGYEAQYGKALGAIVNAVTYTGTNEFESNVFAFGTHDALSMSNRNAPTLRTTGSYSYDVGARVSGPVIRDRFWFAAAWNPRLEHAEKAIGTLGTFPETRSTQVFAGKLTWRPREATNVELALFGDPGTADLVTLWDYVSALTPLNPSSYLQRVETGGINTSARLTTPLGSSGLFEASVSRSTYRDNLKARDSAGVAPVVLDYVSNTIEGGLPWTTINDQERIAVTTRATMAVGRHTLTGGAEYEDNRDQNVFDNPGLGVIFRSEAAHYEVLDQHVDDRVRSKVPTAYLQDSWRLTDRLTLNAGLRWSGQWLEGGSGKTAQRFPDEWQPRAGFNAQLGESRSHRVFGSYGRFFLQEPLNLATLYYVNYFLGLPLLQH